ncbi:MAG: OmpA family protein [Porphyromonadaceae bacterium]|nr:MAG: OmpA family protein [Porphyromonadaceae bacterium]
MKTPAGRYLLISLSLLAVCAPAQILDLRGAVRNKAVNRVNNHIDQTLDKGLDKIESSIKDCVKTNEKIKDAPDAGQDAVQSNQAALQTYSKYDFIPGEKVIFYDDFSQDNIGDFPVLWNTNASGEVVNTNLFPGKWFQIKEEGFYIPETKGDFPDNFTVEFDWITSIQEDRPGVDIGFYIVSGNMKDPSEGGAIPGVAGNKINIGEYSSDYDTYGEGAYSLSGSKDFLISKNTKYHIACWVQKQRLRLYINETKVFDVPKGIPEGYKYNILRFEMGGESSPLISNFRVATGLPDMRNKLITEGKLVTYGIYFDVNSDKIKPESFGTLKGIAAVLNENPDVKVRILGYTDSDGNDAANLDLSKRRAASVKNELSKNFAIDASRMETDGKGESEPVAPNDNPTNKALNRRVEFIKL